MRQFKLADIFQDHMVFQANKPIRFFGVCFCDLDIVITFLDDRYTFKVKQGRMDISLPEYHLKTTPFTVTIQTEKQIVEINDCLIGDVYLFSGQSNMQYVCKDVLDVKKEPNDSLRLYEVPKLPYVGAEEEFDWLYTNNPSWKRATLDAIDDFSAIGYMVGRDICKDQGIPIGIISCNMGDTTIYSWLAKDKIAENLWLKPYLDEYETWKETYKSYEAYANYYNQQVPILMNFYGLLDQYRREGYSSEMVYEKALEVYPNPYLPMGPKNQNRPGGCYETMLNTIIPFTNKGIVYYQGENDVSRPKQYQVAIHSLIESWREAFYDDLLFINCQLAGHEYSDTTGLSVAKLRDAQASIYDPEKNQFVITAIDYGEKNNIHPLHKNEVAKRIYWVIDAAHYSNQENQHSPMFDHFECHGDVATIYTKGNSLELVMKQKDDLGFYAVINADEILPIHDIRIDGNTLQIKVLPMYREIRYAYDGFPSLSIYTTNDLPLLPFRLILK